MNLILRDNLSLSIVQFMSFRLILPRTQHCNGPELLDQKWNGTADDITVRHQNLLDCVRSAHVQQPP
jgi:hypothetical protein